MISFVSRMAASMLTCSVGVVGDADAVGVRDRDAALFGEVLDLIARAVDKDDFDAQRAQDR